MRRTLKQWSDLVVVTVRIREAGDAEKIARLCVDMDGAGVNASVWHASAKFYGTRCHCVPCSQEQVA